MSRSAIPEIPDYYFDREFTCRNCGKVEIWTAKRQQWWYEEAQGPIESLAVECSTCRKKNKMRKIEARRIHLEGIKAKNKRNA
ncbi:MAG: zinc-ribbon domain-containing protein [Puniceicoccales bacterium]|nr:zinc-ribbon domain-containing protein [Puniceicoccales bacterium]